MYCVWISHVKALRFGQCSIIAQREGVPPSIDWCMYGGIRCNSTASRPVPLPGPGRDSYPSVARWRRGMHPSAPPATCQRCLCQLCPPPLTSLSPSPFSVPFTVRPLCPKSGAVTWSCESGRVGVSQVEGVGSSQSVSWIVSRVALSSQGRDERPRSNERLGPLSTGSSPPCRALPPGHEPGTASPGSGPLARLLNLARPPRPATLAPVPRQRSPNFQYRVVSPSRPLLSNPVLFGTTSSRLSRSNIFLLAWPRLGSAGLAFFYQVFGRAGQCMAISRMVTSVPCNPDPFPALGQLL